MRLWLTTGQLSEDDHGEYDSWMELYNKGDMPIDIGGLYFTDSLADPL